MRKTISILVLLASVQNLFAGGFYENALFSINAPESKQGFLNSQPVLMSLPVKNGFSANINIQVQAFSDSLRTYAIQTEKQLKSLNWTLLNKTITSKKLILEYSGKFQGKSMHWYSEVIKASNNVYLITATSLESEWSTLSRSLISSVQSFEKK